MSLDLQAVRRYAGSLGEEIIRAVDNEAQARGMSLPGPLADKTFVVLNSSGQQTIRDLFSLKAYQGWYPVSAGRNHDGNWVVELKMQGKEDPDWSNWPAFPPGKP